MKLVLLGYMASGKSSIGKKLASEIGCAFIDLDSYISTREGMSISQLFKEKGEIYFRKIESQALKEIFEKPQALVLALGGGTPCYANNMEMINQHTVSVYLQASIKELHKKLSKPKNKAKRPLIADLAAPDLLEFITKHLFERRYYYQKASHTVTTDSKSKKEITAEILGLISRERP